MNKLIVFLVSILFLTHNLSYTVIEKSVYLNYVIFLLLFLVSILYTSKILIKFWLLLYFLFLIAISLFSQSILLSLSYVFLLIVYFFIFNLLNNRDIPFFKILFYTSFIIVLLSCFYTFLDPLSINYRGGNIALKGFFKNNNSFAQIIFLTLLTFYNFNRKDNCNLYMIIVFLFLSLLTSSRSIIISILVLLIIEMFKLKKSYLIILLSIAFISILIKKDQLLLLFEKIFRTESFTATDLSESRFQLLMQFKSIFWELPFTGLGIGNQTSVWIYGNLGGGQEIEGIGLHNSFIQILAEQGIIGFIIFIFINIIATNKLFKSNKKLFYTLIVILISSTFESNIYYISSPLAYLYWYIIFFAVNKKGAKNEDTFVAKCD
ncbi:hypothetical protein CW697_02045 [Macrococcoides caseolyticum]|uniref:O-antigen ligase family protein n=1 Tax=Macrococcoides caseolyticum TaxID=69966 RepID=UPI000C337528|nr:O-antigen ligase family protein [Macrococcus caseolyticus]PKF30629.1 hypothetical protein CW697_02045 [Macrococcus caseolyticus]